MGARETRRFVTMRFVTTLVEKVEALYARLLAQGKTVMLSFGGPIDGGPLPPAAFERREALADEMLGIVLQHNLSGITLDFEGRNEVRARSPVFSSLSFSWRGIISSR